MTTNQPTSDYEYTQNLNLQIPAKTNYFKLADTIANFKKIDNFAGLTPPNALTADKLTTARTINGVPFDGTQDVINGLWVYSATETYNTDNIVYGVVDGQVNIYRSKVDDNIGNALDDEDYWEDVLRDYATKSMVDGQWVCNHLTLANEVTAPKSAKITFDLSSYLPNDEYQYEVLFSGYAISGTTAGNYCRLQLSTDVINYGVWLGANVTRSSSNVQAAGNAIIPVGLERKVNAEPVATNSGTITFSVLAYRRLGTNQ